jgi:hypothetical protein
MPSGGGALRAVEASVLLELDDELDEEDEDEEDDDLPLSAAAAAALLPFPFLPFDCAEALETAPAQHRDSARKIAIGFCMPVTFHTDR